jgi:hypothetical protein
MHDAEVRRSYWDASAETFAQTNSTTILGHLVARHPFDVDRKQRDAWLVEIEDLKALAIAIPHSHLFLEFAIPRMGKRADAILLARGVVFVLEYKIGPTEFMAHAADQVLD